MNFLLKMMDFVLKMMGFVFTNGESRKELRNKIKGMMRERVAEYKTTGILSDLFWPILIYQAPACLTDQNHRYSLPAEGCAWHRWWAAAWRRESRRERGKQKKNVEEDRDACECEKRTHEFTLMMTENICIKNKDLCVKNKGFCIKSDGFCKRLVASWAGASLNNAYIAGYIVVST